jgi:hypothetical protein
MGTITANWEDAETNRIVECAVEYTTAADRVEIERVTPTSVTFIDPASKSPVRKIGVWTRKGADHLVSKIRQAGGIERFELEVEQTVLARV